MKHLHRVSASRMDTIVAGGPLPQLANGLLVKERQLEISTQFVALLNEVSMLIKSVRGDGGSGGA